MGNPGLIACLPKPQLQRGEVKRCPSDDSSGCGIVKSRSLLYNPAVVEDPSDGLRICSWVKVVVDRRLWQEEYQ